jgi:oligopeptide transport system permease protein
MIGYALRRLLLMPVVLFVVASLTFFLVRTAPGGPFDDERRLPPEIERNLQAQCDRSAPLMAQYVRFLKGWLTFDEVDGCTGYSLKYPGRTVREIISEAFPVSVHLGALALLFAMAFGMLAGMLAAVRQNTWVDYTAMGTAIAGISVPNFVLGPLLILLFSLELGWLPPALWEGPDTWVLPAVTLGASYAAYISRLARAGLLEIVRQDFIRTARAKGLPGWLVVWRHGLRGGLLPVVSFLGPATSALFTGSVVVEQIFGIPGLGRTFIESALNRDYNLVMGTVLVYAAFLMAMNLLVDVLYGVLDPRVRADG